MSREREALGAFLRARRDQLSPAQAGMRAFPGARRVPGLRREELAYLAGLSPDYYSRVEQGRQANISAEVLEALARALRLDQVELEHLRDLASPPRTSAQRPRIPHEQRPDPGLLRIMAALDHLPVLMLGHRGEVLARNRLLQVVLGHPIPVGSSFIRYLILDPLARERIVDWDVFARASVASLRREEGRRPHDGLLRDLIDELRSADADVARWWEDHAVRDYSSVSKRIRHPASDDLHFAIEIIGAPHEEDQRLVVYTVEPNSASERMLPILASWDIEISGSGSPSASTPVHSRTPR